jgi:GT2 family glycosyltransferase
MGNEPLVSVSVVNYNGRKFLPEFFASLFNQTYKNFEVIFVDNDSSDDSIEYVQSHFPQVKVIKNKDNSGYAEGNNIGFRNSRGEYVLVMNNDTLLKEDLIENMLRAFEEIPNLGVVQPMVKLMNDREKLDACGSFWTNTGFNYHYGIYKRADLPLYNQGFPVYGVKGMCMMVPRHVIDEVGLFDPDFWCYFEETDFCHRLWLSGYECWYYPKTFIYHHMGGTSSKKPSSLIQFHSFKNRLCSYLKNLGPLEMTKVLPVYLFMNVVWSLAFLTRFDTENFLVVYRALWWNVVHFPETMKKRRYIQSVLRRKADGEIFRKVRRNPRWSYYLYLLKGLEKYID